MRIWVAFFLAFLIYLKCDASVSPDTTWVIYDEGKASYDLKEHSQVAVFSETDFDLSKLLDAEAFKPFSIDRVSEDERYNVLKCHIINPYSETKQILMTSLFVDYVHVYDYNSEKGFPVRQAGNSGFLAGEDQPLGKDWDFGVTAITLEPNSRSTYWLVLDSATPGSRRTIHVSIMTSFLGQNKSKFLRVYERFELFNFFMIGLVVMLILYNAAMAIRLKQRIMMLLTLYNLGYFVWIALHAGILIKLGIGEDLIIDRTARIVAPNLFIIVGYVLFVYFFGDLRKNAPWLGRWLLCLGLLYILVQFSLIDVSNYGGPIRQISTMMPLVIYFSSLAASIQVYRSRHPFRLYLLASAIVMMVGVSIYLTAFLIPSVHYFPVHVAYETAIVLEIIIFTMANTHRIRLLQREKMRLELEKEVADKELHRKNRELVSLTTKQIRHNEELENLKSELKGNSSTGEGQKLAKEISRLQQFDMTWENFKLHFENVHPSFFEALMEKNGRLTGNEQRLCAYIKMGLKSKEVANIQGVSVRAVHKARERLKKKLALEADMSLDQFVREIAAKTG